MCVWQMKDFKSSDLQGRINLLGSPGGKNQHLRFLPLSLHFLSTLHGLRFVAVIGLNTNSFVKMQNNGKLPEISLAHTSPWYFYYQLALHNSAVDSTVKRDWQAPAEVEAGSGKITVWRSNAWMHSGRTSPSLKHSAETVTGSGVPGWKEETQVTHWRRMINAELARRRHIKTPGSQTWPLTYQTYIFTWIHKWIEWGSELMSDFNSS